MFDIALPGESDGTVTYHTGVAPARPLRPASLVLPGLVEPKTHMCELCILYLQAIFNTIINILYYRIETFEKHGTVIVNCQIIGFRY